MKLLSSFLNTINNINLEIRNLFSSVQLDISLTLVKYIVHVFSGVKSNLGNFDEGKQ